MRNPRFLIDWALIAVLLCPFECRAADDAAPSFATQSEGGPASRTPASQPGRSTTTLEIAPQPFDKGRNSSIEVAPQPSDKLSDPSARQIPSEQKYQPSQTTAKLDRDLGHDQLDERHRPYLGIELEYTTQCYLGMEEHGFEVVNVYAGSPAARAGMQGRTTSTPLGDLGAAASLIVLPVSFFTIPMLRRSGALGFPGDLIVAVDDQRVRTPEEMMRMLDHLKPGDTAYVTALRPVPGGSHQTIRFALHIDREVKSVGR